MKTLGSILDPGLLARSKNLDALSHLLMQLLPLECSGHFQVASIRQRSLILVCESPAWATRLRQLSPEIIRLLNQHEYPFQHVEIKTRLQSMPDLQPKDINHAAVKRHLSESASKLLASTSASIADPSLRDALLKLSQTVIQ